MKLALMNGDTVPAAELRDLGFHAVQMFFGHGAGKEADDPTPAAVDAVLAAGNTRLAAMTLHVDLVNAQGLVQADADRLEDCVRLTAALDGRFGDNARPILVWHPGGYPGAEDTDDAAVFAGLVAALRQACGTAESLGVDVAVEITRAGSVGSAETYLRLRDHVASPALKVCLDAANFCPDRTPLARAVRMLGPDIAIAHGKDSHFHADGKVADYGPIGTGKLDYPTYIAALRAHAAPAYFVLEYYRDRDQLLHARDVVAEQLAKAT